MASSRSPRRCKSLYWVVSGSSSGNGLVWNFGGVEEQALRHPQEKRRVLRAGTFGTFVNPLYEDHKGNLWVASETGLWRWAPGSPVRYAFPNGVVQVTALAEDDSGILL